MTTKETWTFYLRRLLLFARLSYYFIPCLRLTKSPTLPSAPLLYSTQQVSSVVIENVTDIFFPKWSFLERCGPGWPDNERRPEEETAAGSVSCFVIIDFCFDWEANWARGRAWKMSKSLGWIAWVGAAITNHFLIANLKLLVIYSQPIEKPTHIKDPQPFAWLMINQVNQIVLICTNTIIKL